MNIIHCCLGVHIIYEYIDERTDENFLPHLAWLLPLIASHDTRDRQHILSLSSCVVYYTNANALLCTVSHRNTHSNAHAHDAHPIWRWRSCIWLAYVARFTSRSRPRSRRAHHISYNIWNGCSLVHKHDDDVFTIDRFLWIVAAAAAVAYASYIGTYMKTRNIALSSARVARRPITNLNARNAHKIRRKQTEIRLQL